MGKSLPKKQYVKKQAEKPPLIPEKYHDAVFVILLTLSVFIFLFSAIAGGGFNEFDNVASLSFVPYLEKASDSGDFPLWMPYIFGGMPGYPALLVTGERVWDIVPQLFFGISGFFRTLFGNDAARIALYYALYAAGMYLLIRYKKKDKAVAFLSAFAAVFSTWVITWIMIGHNTKPIVFAMFPFIFYFMERLREKFSVLYSVLLLFSVHIMFEGGHLQMIFYGACAFGLYLLFEFISRLVRKKEPLKVLRAGGVLAIAAILAFLMSSDRYLAVQEYTPYSTRGSAPIQKTDKQQQDDSGGNDYEYATMWSYSPMETFTFLVPGYFGHGVRDWKPAGSPAGSEQKISTYWGAKETEDSPPYMGILVLAFAVMGFVFYRKDTFAQFLLVLIVFSWLLSMGKNLPWLYDIFYYYVPSFNKFRAPSMALALMHFAVPILAGYGIVGFLRYQREDKKTGEGKAKVFLIVSGIFLGLGLFFAAAFKSTFLSAVGASKQFASLSNQADPSIIADIKDFVWSSMIGDWLLGSIILLLGAFLVYMFIKGKTNRTILIVSLLVLFAFDLWRVNYRRMDVAESSIQEEVFQRKSEVYNYLKQDNDVFRVADFSSNPANIPAYFFMENINGYHAAKLRVYQDILDLAQPEPYAGSTSVLFNPFLWNIMNVKYIITNRPFGEGTQPIFQSQLSGDYVYNNPGALPRAFFVGGVKKAKQMEILTNLREGNFDPVQTAFIEKDLVSEIEIPDSTAFARIKERKNEYLSFDVKASGNNFLFISEIYYPAGWTAYIDGKETDIIKTNFAFRGLIVPPGEHKIEMKFRSTGFEQGKTISTIVNIFVMLTFVFAIYIEWRNKKKPIVEKNKDS